MPEEEDATVEEYEKTVRIVNLTTFAGTVISVLLNIWVMISLCSDLLGIDVGEFARKIIEYGWRLPPDWVQQYQPFLYTLQWILFVTVITDTAISYKYMVDGEPRVPRPYLKLVSFIGFFCGMWLYLAYHIMAYGIIFFASFITFTYVMFAEREEEIEEEEEEEFEPEIWKGSASIFDVGEL
ncbi:MAG TPA: hypothetical protein ENG66_06565 [Thermococcus sp.]|nr:MAG: hypothetical protein DRP04_03405 [Archaeoglobales archaeon]HDH45033.1 hypothetical protein [Thermococcus sp.]